MTAYDELLVISQIALNVKELVGPDAVPEYDAMIEVGKIVAHRLFEAIKPLPWVPDFPAARRNDEPLPGQEHP